MKCIVLSYGKTLCDAHWDSVGSNADFYKMYYCLSGKAIYNCEGNTAEFTPGNLYIIKQNTPYKIVAKKDFDFEVLWFHADFYLPLIKPFIEVGINDGSVEYHLLKSLEAAVDKHKELLPKIIEILIELIISNNDLLKVFDEQILKAVRYITNHYKENITNETIAKELGYNKNYFIKKFKNTLGISPHKYLIKLKMTFARKYLMENNSVKQVSSLIGYSDPNMFSRDFKRYYGFSPSRISKNNKIYM